ncbi:MAG TPA: hypothetical protein VJ045_02660 [Hyphomicrobiaceae bacterium]|nr:hypothetical protein [Hyphomicrobiaceae bacterium]
MVLRILLNGLIMAAEIAAVAGVAAAGYQHPFLFAAATAALSLGLGLNLEAKRLRNELPFYFGAGAARSFALVPIVGALEALLKGVLAGLAALFTFSGTNMDRLYWVAVVFGLTVYAGSSVLRYLSLRLDATPSRWGYFRLAPPLGLLFSAGLAALAAWGLVVSASVGDIGWTMVWEMPAKPSVEQVSELLFQLKQAFDDFIVTLFSAVMDREWAKLLGIAVSVNVLAGFVASVYAAVIASAVRRAEDTLL